MINKLLLPTTIAVLFALPNHAQAEEKAPGVTATGKRLTAKEAAELKSTGREVSLDELTEVIQESCVGKTLETIYRDGKYEFDGQSLDNAALIELVKARKADGSVACVLVRAAKFEQAEFSALTKVFMKPPLQVNLNWRSDLK